jgi:hypothetical protein
MIKGSINSGTAGKTILILQNGFSATDKVTGDSFVNTEAVVFGNVMNIVAGNNSNKCQAVAPGTYTLSNLGTPKGAMFSTGHGVMNNFHFTTVTMKTPLFGQPVCINSIQLGSLTDPRLKVTNAYIYNKSGGLIAKVPSSDWYQVPNSTSWAAWVPVSNLNFKGNTTMRFLIKADVLDSSSMTPGLFNLGISGMNFDSPGARANGLPMSFGEVFSVN